MNDEQLKKIQDELLKGIDADLDKESNLISTAKEIAAKLYLGGTVKEEIDGKVLVFNYRTYKQGKTDKIFMTVANPFMYQVGRDKYKPYMVDVEVDNDFSLRENLASVVEAFLRHIFDMVQVEEL